MTNSKIKISGLSQRPIHTLGLGVFDGLHRGHQAILSKCDALLTFHPHPDNVLKKTPHTIERLMTIPEMRLCVPKLFVLHFNTNVSQIDPLTFLEDVLENQLQPKRIIVGADFRFGHQGKGNATTLQNWAQKKGIHVQIINLIKQNGHYIKSGTIRQLIAHGAFENALQLLGRPFMIQGIVVKGENRGKSLGFPTANLKIPRHKLIPENGVYGGHVTIQKKPYPAIIYIGSKPTFSTQQQIKGIEIHIPHFNQTIYGKKITVYLTQFIRGEQKFTNSQQLIDQIRKDLKKLENASV